MFGTSFNRDWTLLQKKGISANVIEVKNAMARNTSIRGCGNGNDKKKGRNSVLNDTLFVDF